MLMKFYTNGALEQFISQGRADRERIKLRLSMDMARGLRFMHIKGVAHCDIKPANILVDQDYRETYSCVLTDFGIAQMYSENAQLVRAFKVVNLRGVSIEYAAPEAITRYREQGNVTKQLALAGDVYSFGMVLFRLLKAGDGLW